MKRSRRPPAPHGARAPRSRRAPPSGNAPVAGEPIPPDPPAGFDDGPDRPSIPSPVRDSEQVPDPGGAGEESVREPGEDAWTDAERGDSPTDAP